MAKDVAEDIRAIPEEAFRERPDPLRRLTYLERLRWLQQTAYFIWKYKGAARNEEGHLPTGMEPSGERKTHRE